MGSNIEKFIRQNRKDFDTEQPSSSVWEQVEKTIPPAKQEKKFSLRDMIKWSAAAAVLFAILTSVYFIYIRSHEKQTAVTSQPPVKPDALHPDELSRIAPEYAVQFRDVSQSISAKQQELKAVTSGRPELYRQFEADLKVLDSTYAALRKQALQTPNRDVLIKAMIQNLQLQAELLGRQLMIMQEFKKTQNQKNETSI